MGSNYEKRYLDWSDAYPICKELSRCGNSINNGYVDALISAKAALNSMFGVGADYSTYQIKNVIFNNPATIVFWTDNTKTVVKCGPYDRYDPEKGLAMAFCKKMMGNRGNYYNVFKKWLPEESETMEDKPLTSISMYEPQTFTFTLDPSCVKVEDIFGNAFDLSTGRTINKEDNDHE